MATFTGVEFDPTTGLVFVPDPRPGKPPGAGSYIHIGDGVLELDLPPVKAAASKAKQPAA